MEVIGPDVSKYGVIMPGEKIRSVNGLTEKPKADDAPPNLASIGRYVLTPDILRNQKPSAGGEIQLADAIHAQAQSGIVEALPLSGLRFDCGRVNGYIGAIAHMAAKRWLGG